MFVIRFAGVCLNSIRRNARQFLLLIGMLMIIQSVDAKPVLKETIFKGIEFEELLTTVVEEYRKVGFEFKESKKFEAPFGFTLEIDFVYLPKFTGSHDEESSGRLLVVKQNRGVDKADTEFSLILYGIRFDRSVNFLEGLEGDQYRQRAYTDFGHGLSNLKIRLNKYFLRDIP